MTCTVCGRPATMYLGLGFIDRRLASPLFSTPKSFRWDAICDGCYCWVLMLDIFPLSDCGTPIEQRYLHVPVSTRVRVAVPA